MLINSLEYLYSFLKHPLLGTDLRKIALIFKVIKNKKILERSKL